MGATLARDVPFSAIYWASLEPIRCRLLPRDRPVSKGQVLAANLVAGSLGGALAAAITTPLVNQLIDTLQFRALPLQAAAVCMYHLLLLLKGFVRSRAANSA